ncbi:MAG: type II toxin-antitoxin system Phd/YefM family antitoxin [Nitrospirota bacterium]
MMKLNIHEAKTHLSKYLTNLKAGARIVLCKRNQPVAHITRLSEVPTGPRPIGLAKQTFSVPASFFERLPDDLRHAFEAEKA